MANTRLVYGIHPVREALSRNRTPGRRLVVVRNRALKTRLQAIVRLAQEQAIEIEWADTRQLDELTAHGVHQGVALLGSEPAGEPESLAELIERHGKKALVLVLDQVQDPHNLGACMRTADAVGVHAIVVPRRQAVGLTPVVRKVASGAVESVPFFQVTNLARTLRELKQLGLWIIAVEADASETVFESDLKGPLVLVLGAEGRGLRRLTRASRCMPTLKA
jgi:23S rRNA (guanosine2251-2'-O)-methyltransferase